MEIEIFSTRIKTYWDNYSSKKMPRLWRKNECFGWINLELKLSFKKKTRRTWTMDRKVQRFRELK